MSDSLQPNGTVLTRQELLQRRLAERGLAREASTPQVRMDGARCSLPSALRRFWFVQNQNRKDTTLNIVAGYELSGPLVAARLQQSFVEVLLRHEILSTTYHLGSDGNPVAQYQRNVKFLWNELDSSELTESAAFRRLQVMVQREANSPFDLTADSPIRVTLVKINPVKHVLLLTVHHICWDDDSWRILFDDLSMLYQGRGLPPLEKQYLSLPQHHSLTDLDYWQQNLSPLPSPLTLPQSTTYVQSDTSDSCAESALIVREIPSVLTDQVVNFAREISGSPFMVYAAVLDVLVHRITAATDFLLAVPVINRPGEAEAVIGYFGNSVFPRTVINSRDSF